MGAGDILPRIKKHRWESGEEGGRGRFARTKKEKQEKERKTMLKDMKIRARMILSYMIIVALLLATGIVSIVMLGSVGGALETFYNTSFQAVDQSWTGKRAISALRADLLQATVDNTGNTQMYVAKAKE